MLQNYFLISLRNIRKHLSYSVINVAGLGLGLATCLLLVLWITHELSYDTFHSKADRLYRVSLEYALGGQVNKTAVSPNALLPALLALPEAETGVRLYNPSAWTPFIVRHGDARFQEKGFCFADSTFFQVFDFKLLSGDAAHALTQPNAVVLTASAARKYFGSANPVGQTLQVNNGQDFLITGVMADPPANSSLQFDFMASFNSLAAGRGDLYWWNANYQTYVVTHPQADIAAMERKISAVAMKAVMADAGDVDPEGNYVKYNFMRHTDIHLRSDLDNEEGAVGDIRYIYMFSAIALLILGIACMNYINLATARAADRAREVGIRKVVGALRQQLFFQFIGESILITGMAFILAYGLAHTLLPLFNDLTARTFTSAMLWQPTFVLSCLGILLIIALLAGAYPALAITSFKPVSVLKGNFKTSGRGVWLRKTLVVAQFCISIVLIIGTMVIYKQLHFIQSKKLGYDRENTMVLPLDSKTKEVFSALRQELLRRGVASQVARGSESPSQIRGGYNFNINATQDMGTLTTGLIADEAYIPAMGMTIVAGRNFTSKDIERAERDTVYTFIFNESALREVGLKPEQAVGKTIQMNGRLGEIIGVVSDFHFTSLHKSIGPLVIFPEVQQMDKILIKLAPGDVASRIQSIQSIYTSLVPHRPFEFEFVDQQYAAQYQSEQRMGHVFIVFAVLAIAIASLGLLGLVSFSAVQKTKEIGIRKVLGASGASIVMLISKDFSRLILVSIVLGIPLAWWGMNQWLQGFAYQVEIGWVPLVAAALLCIVIAFGTTLYQSIKASLINPAETLRNN